MFGTSRNSKKKEAPANECNKKEFTHEMTMLILGCKESGKTTTWRHLQFLGESFIEDKKHFHRVIYGNTISAIIKLMDIADKHNLQLSQENQERAGRLSGMPTNMAEFKLPRLPLRLVYDCKCMWEDPAIQSAYQISLTNSEYHTPGRLQYYMDNIFRILSPDFQPAKLDVLSAYEQTDMVQTAEVYYRKVKINAHCYPGDTCEDKKWDSLMDSLNVLVYIVNLNDYDQSLPKGNSPNRLQHAISTLKDLMGTKAYQACSHAFVFLNSTDLFKTKCATVDLKCCFPEYDGGLDPEKAFSFVDTFFTQLVSTAPKPTKVIAISALDKDSLFPALDELIDVALPSLPPSLASSSSSTTLSSSISSSSSQVLPPSSPPASPVPARNGASNGGEKKEKKKGKKLLSVESGFESVQGRRRTMEDKHLILDNFLTTFPLPSGVDDGLCAYYAVYDGHGGVDTANIVVDTLHKNILQDPLFAKGEHEAAIKHAFDVTDTSVLAQVAKSGSTAVVAVIVGTHLIVANAGDSECVLIRQSGAGKKAAQSHEVMSYKHTPSDENEKLRITTAGGFIYQGRLFGSLAVSRSFGDKEYKQDNGQNFVSAEPHIKQLELTPDDQFLVMACDGLWDKLTYEDVIGTITRLRKEGKSSNDICKTLAQEALDKDSMDNITVVLVCFNWKK